MLISSNFASQTRWSIFTLGPQMHQATPGYNGLLIQPIDHLFNHSSIKMSINYFKKYINKLKKIHKTKDSFFFLIFNFKWDSRVFNIQLKRKYTVN